MPSVKAVDGRAVAVRQSWNDPALCDLNLQVGPPPSLRWVGVELDRDAAMRLSDMLEEIAYKLPTSASDHVATGEPDGG